MYTASIERAEGYHVTVYLGMRGYKHYTKGWRVILIPSPICMHTIPNALDGPGPQGPAIQ